MKLIDLTLDSPVENIAYDESLLVLAEHGQRGEILRFWESGTYFVATGIGSRYNQEIYRDRCQNDNIPIIRRQSAGGSVVLGPGCLAYSLILSYERDDRLKDIRTSYNYILTKVIQAIRSIGKEAYIEPVSDIVICNKKVSGNAQMRKLNFFLHHGTLLYDFDLSRIPFYLKEPVKMPHYRGGRSHREFVTNLSLPVSSLKKEIAKKWGEGED